MQPIHGEADLDALRRRFMAYAVILAWARQGLFEALADGRPRRAEDLPGNARSIAVTAPILAHLGLLVRHGGAGETAWALSTSGRSLWAAGALQLDADWRRLGDLGRLDRVLAEGGPVPGPDGVRRASSGGVWQDDPAGARAFLDGLYRRSAVAAGLVADLVEPGLPAGGTVLDLGGGHGRYGRELADRGFRVTLFDRPMVIEFARERHGEALDYRGGDFLDPTADLGGPYDLVLMSNIVHGLAEAELDGLLERLRVVTRPGGRVAMKDMFLDDSGVGPEPAVLFGLVMLLYTEGGRSYGTGELSRRLREAGFESAEHVAVPDQGWALLIAR